MVTLTCISGFLGQSHDWDFLREAGFVVDAIDFERAATIAGGEVLVGYSMGGRLALEALARGARFERAIIVSAGLNLESGREERRQRDEMWARRFESDSWEELLRDWNAQPVFGGHSVERREHDSERSALARALRLYSPGVLPPLAPRLGRIDIPLLWIAGERDLAYVDTGRRAVAGLPHARLWICPESGHRVPWEQRESFVREVRAFICPERSDRECGGA